MKILVVQESDWFDRGPLQSHHLMERLSKRGHEIIVIDTDIRTRDDKKNLFSKREVFKQVHKVIEDGNVTVIRPSIIKIPVLNYLSLIFTHWREIRRQLDEFKPDVIIGFGILNANISINLAKKRGIPFVYYIIDELHRLVPQPIFQRLARHIERKNLQNADVTLSINEGLREYTIQLGAPREKTQVIRAGVKPEWFSNADRNKKRYELGFEDDDLVLFFMGLLYEFSGIKEVAEALIKQRENSNIKLLVVGNGDLWEYLQTIRKMPGMADKIITVGWQPYNSLPDFLAAADICLLPAQKNDIMKNIVPIKMYEYMAAGKPVIATNLSGIMKEFGNDNGVIYIEKPEEAVKKANELSDVSLRDEIGLNSRRFVEPNDWNKITDMFEKMLIEISQKNK